MTDHGNERAKRHAGQLAATEVRDGMRIGLGTGSTVRFFTEAVAESRLNVRCVATSHATAELAKRLGLHLEAPDDIGTLDLAVDGADEVAPSWDVIKGGGGAHSREKIVAEMARRFVVVVDSSKVVATLGALPLPLEVLPFAPEFVAARVRALGAQNVTRRARVSDDGNILLDAAFESIPGPERLGCRLSCIPGLVAHGLFAGKTIARVIVGTADGAHDLPRRARPATD